MRLFCALILGGLGSATRAAAAPDFSSGPQQVALLELYSSEGCSSCPPAEQWLAARQDDAGLWRDYVPVAFHVAYWDHLGWKDRWADPAFTDRQRAYARLWGSRSIYTPALVWAGIEWRIGRPTPQTGLVGVLTARADASGTKWTLGFEPAAALVSADEWEGHVAVLSNGLTSQVTRGENRGRTLEHGFVVVNLQAKRLTPSRDAASPWTAEVRLPDAIDSLAERPALAVWVTRTGEVTPVQATGGWW